MQYRITETPFANDTRPAKDNREHRTLDGRPKGTKAGQRGKDPKRWYRRVCGFARITRPLGLIAEMRWGQSGFRKRGNGKRAGKARNKLPSGVGRRNETDEKLNGRKDPVSVGRR